MKKYGLIGSNLSYSYSKFIHEYLIKAYFIHATYDLIEVDFVNKTLLKEYDGLNITIPYKEDVIDLIDINNSFGPVNTIKNCNNLLEGYNTDILGFKLLVEKINLDNIESVVVLGSGATSKMVQHYFEDINVVVLSRSDAIYNYNMLDDIKADLVVNTTPVGMDSYESILSDSQVKQFKGIIDLNYNPLNSKLCNLARVSDVKYINGLYMLIEQAIKAFELWNNINVESDIIDEIYINLVLNSNSKVALIGMPLTGKTTLTMKYNGVDLDREVELYTNKKISQLIKDNTFRKYETIVAKKLVKSESKLISLGGGFILNPENLEVIKDYLIVFYDVELERLVKRYRHGLRPLLKSKQDLIDTYNTRRPLYLRYSNITLKLKELEKVLYELSRNKWT